MKLLEIQNNYPTVTAEALMIPEFKVIWDRDKDKNKNNAKTEIAYIWFKLDFKSPYLAYPEEERESILIKDLFKKSSYIPDKDMVIAMQRFEEFRETPITLTLQAALTGLDKIRRHINTVDLDERTRSGGLVHKARELNQTIGELDKSASSINGLLVKAYQEEESFEKTRGNAAGGALQFDRD